MKRFLLIAVVAFAMYSCSRNTADCNISPIDNRPDVEKMFLKGSVRYLDEDYTQFGVEYTYHYQFNELGYLEVEELTVGGEREYMREYHYDETGYKLLQTDIYNDDNDTIIDGMITYDYNVNGSMLEITSYSADSTVQFIEVYRGVEGKKMEVSAYIGGNKDSLSRRDMFTYDEQCRKIKKENLFPFTEAHGNMSEFVYYGDTCREDFYFNGVLDMKRYTIGENKELPDKIIIESDGTVTDIAYTYDERGNEIQMMRKVIEDGDEMVYETTSGYEYDEYGNWTECKDTEHTVKRTISYFN